MGIFDRFESNPENEVEGIWIDYGDFEVKMCRAGGANRRYGKLFASMQQKMLSQEELQQIATGNIPEDSPIMDKLDQIDRKVYSKCIILDWRGPGLVDKEGNAIPFSESNVYDLLQKLPEFFNDVKIRSTNMKTFLEKKLETEVKK